MAAKKEIALHPLVKTLFEELKKRRVSVPDFSEGTGIPKDRVYKWKQQGTAPKDEDAKVIREWLKMDKYPTSVVRKEDEIQTIIGSHEERLLRIEAHLEVFENAIAGLLAENKSDFAKKVGELRREVQGAVNRRFDELQKKPSGH
jgi:hypothetical protein